MRNAVARRRDNRSATYLGAEGWPRGALACRLGQFTAEALDCVPSSHGALCELYLDHRFDLLGSGWVRVHHGMRCSGLEGARYEMGAGVNADPEGAWLAGRINAANVPESTRIWRMIDRGYRPIDWHLDFKSGYRWEERTWYLDIPFGHKAGVDVKVPWELTRMQHLPQLAIAAVLAQAGKMPSGDPERYRREFRNEVLDFIATNPPRFGVNWRCAMDVAIRAVNWLVAYDVFCAHGGVFDDDFRAIFERSVYEHGLHIRKNLEWTPGLRGNHYLADIVGLLFIAAYLPSSPDVDEWLAFAAGEFGREVRLQFYDDGANIEASTCYHLLSSEMAVYATALLLGLPDEKKSLVRASGPGADLLSDEHREQLEKMAEFVVHITKPDGCIPQIGDNDSGRFLKPIADCRQITVRQAKEKYANLRAFSGMPEDGAYWEELSPVGTPLVAAACGLLDRADLDAFAGRRVETALVGMLAAGTRYSARCGDDVRSRAEAAVAALGDRSAELITKDHGGGQAHRYQIDAPGSGLLDDLSLYAYPDFGLYVYRSKRLYLAVRCGPQGNRALWGHAHNDQLSIELCIDGHDVAVDPGTYLYTPHPEIRNTYRSVRAHHAPQISERISGDAGEVFVFKGRASAACLRFDRGGFTGVVEAFGTQVVRTILLKETGILIEDAVTKGVAPRPVAKVPYSNGYGRACGGNGASAHG